MQPLASERYLMLSKVLRIVGFAGFGALFISLQILTAYYSLHRPRFPESENGWSTRLQWSFNGTTYGTAQEKANQLRLFNSVFPFFVIGILGEGIRKMHEKNEPWKTRQL